MRIARSDGRRWTPLGGGLGNLAFGLAGFEDGSGPALYACGYFLYAGGRVSAYIAKWGCVPGLMLGDTNCDGVVNTWDITPFVKGLVSPGQYESLYPDCDLRTADCNHDGVVDNFDIHPFVELLTGG